MNALLRISSKDMLIKVCRPFPHTSKQILWSASWHHLVKLIWREGKSWHQSLWILGWHMLCVEPKSLDKFEYNGLGRLGLPIWRTSSLLWKFFLKKVEMDSILMNWNTAQLWMIYLLHRNKEGRIIKKGELEKIMNMKAHSFRRQFYPLIYYL